MKQLEIIKKALPIINVNFDEVKESLIEQLSKYEKIIVTEETLADCISMQRELAGVRNKIDGMRLDIQREMKAPLDHFGSQMKELFNVVVETEKPIKEGIAVFEEKRKEEKRIEINSMVKELSEPLDEKHSDKFVFSAKWMNKGATIPTIKEEIIQQVSDLLSLQTAFGETVSAIREIAASASEGLTTAIDPEPYIRKADNGGALTAIVMEINAAAKSRREAENAAIEASRVKEEAKVEEKTELAPAPKQEDVATQEPAVPVRSVTIMVTSTDEKLTGLASYMNANGISFEKINV